MWGQNHSQLTPERHKAEKRFANSSYSSAANATAKSSTAHWSEDFASGIPAGWTSVCLDTNNAVNPAPEARWVYRGPNTSPNKDTGSIGGYSGFDPIQSPSQGNGFVIFDSDYLDNGGIAGNFGNGLAPTPHLGQLTTDTIDLSGLTLGKAYRLQFHSYLRKFTAFFRVMFSPDGGQTWGDTTYIFNDPFSVNGSNQHLETLNLPVYLAGSPDVMIRWEMGGDDAYYFWMLDDIEIIDLPANDVQWVVANEAPLHHIEQDQNPHSPAYGHLTTRENRHYGFSSAVTNNGGNTQTNCKLSMEWWLGGSLVHTASSPIAPQLLPGDSLLHADLKTTIFVPPSHGTYTCVWTFESDSMDDVNAPKLRDTTRISVGDSIMSQDFGVVSNSIGTDMSGIQAIASKIILRCNERLINVKVNLSSLSEAGGFIEVELFDTTGFDRTAATPGTNLAYGSYTLGTNDPGTQITIPVSDANGNIPYIPVGAYYAVIRMSNANGEVRIQNDASVTQIANSSLMYIGGDRWYEGFANSSTLMSPHIKLYLHGDPYHMPCDILGLEEPYLKASLYPNPAGDYFEIAVDESGDYNWEAYTVLGQKVAEGNFFSTGQISSRVETSDWKSGAYIIRIESNGRSTNQKLQKF
ncbi:MAG: hypothetical protein SchgKO_08320 [Schleiferiaceae bacterium]